MSETDEKSPRSAPPTPEAHGNRDQKPAGERAHPDDQRDEQRDDQHDAAAEESVESADLSKANSGKTRAIVEAILFASDEPLSRGALQEALAEIDADHIKRALQNLRLEYSGTHRGIHLVEVAGGFQLRTNPDFKDHIVQMYEARPRKLSPAAMETLAIVAYQQPLTRADVEEIRGVDCSGVIRTLDEHRLIQTIGRLDDLGRPHIYGTTDRFLEFFSLDSLADLPALDASELEAIEEMYAEELEQAALDDSQQTDGQYAPDPQHTHDVDDSPNSPDKQE